MLAKVLHVVQRAAPLSKEGPEFTDSIICVIATIDTIGSIPVRGTADNAFSSLPPLSCDADVSTPARGLPGAYSRRSVP